MRGFLAVVTLLCLSLWLSTTLAFPQSGAPDQVSHANSCVGSPQTLCVDSPNSNHWLGTDIGAWINSAYASLPASPGPISTVAKILVLPDPLGACYSFSTPIVLAAKPVQIDFQGSCLRFTATSGTAISDDPGQANQMLPRLENLKLLGPCKNVSCSGVTAVGIDLGPKNGFVGGLLQNLQIGGFGAASGFQIGLKDNLDTAYFWNCENCLIYGNHVGYLANSSSGVIFNGGVIAQNDTGIQSTADLKLFGTTFGDNTVAITGVGFYCDGCHFENISLPPIYFVGPANASVTVVGGIFLDDAAAGSPTPYMLFIGGKGHSASASIYGTSVYSNGRVTKSFIVTEADYGGFDLHVVYQGFSAPGQGRINNELTMSTKLTYESVPIYMNAHPPDKHAKH
jgi:hypothetical protein